MITKNELINIWASPGDIPQKYKPLFSTGFTRLAQGTFMTEEDLEDYTQKFRKHNPRTCITLYRSADPQIGHRYSNENWDENLWLKLLKAYIKSRFRYTYSYEICEVIDGIVCLLEMDVPHLPVDVVPDEYRKFYNDTEYGYYGFPHMIDIADVIDIDISSYICKFRGFTREEDVPKFDMRMWKELFKTSKQITTLSKSVSNGEMIDIDTLPVYDFGQFRHFDIEKMYFENAEYMAVIHHMVGHYIPLRTVYTGSNYVFDLISEYGHLIGFYKKSAVYKINTVQGFSFYTFSGQVFIDDISIKKIIFGKAKPANLELDTDERIFIVYNKETGYWQLPKLHYPVKFKNFVQDLLKKQKKTIGKWSDTVVFANSRTLCGDTYHFDLSNYPDVRTEGEFFEKIASSSIENALKKLKLPKELSELGMKVKVEFDNNHFDYNKIIKPLNCVTQEDIDKYANPANENAYETEYYKK